MDEELERHEFEKMIANIRRKQAEASAASLSLAEMEYEMDRCPAPWQCPKKCYEARLGCCRQRVYLLKQRS